MGYNTENNNYINVNRNHEHKKHDKKYVKSTSNNTGVILWILGCLYSTKWKWFLPPLLACVCYSNGLTGDYVHDDIFAIKRNNDVIGFTSIKDVFVHDFWGRPITSNLSHKSYRPLTTLSFRYVFDYIIINSSSSFIIIIIISVIKIVYIINISTSNKNDKVVANPCFPMRLFCSYVYVYVCKETE